MLIANPSHVSYVTNDLDAAMEAYRTRYGVEKFMMYDHDTSPGGPRLALAYTGDIFIELLQPGPASEDFFKVPFEPEMLTIRHHHMGYLVQGDEAWDQLLTDLDRQKFPIVLEGEQPGFVRYLFADTRAVDGIYREFVMHTGKEGHAMYARIPRN